MYFMEDETLSRNVMISNKKIGKTQMDRMQLDNSRQNIRILQEIIDVKKMNTFTIKISLIDFPEMVRMRDLVFNDLQITNIYNFNTLKIS